MGHDFEKCLEKRKLIKFDADEQIIRNEMENAHSDLKESKEEFSRGGYKWATVKGYYSMFHAAKALLFRLGYRERGHYCLLVALRELGISLIGARNIDNFEAAMTLRHDANYESKFTEIGAEDTIENAEAFIIEVEKAMNKLKSNGEKKG